MTDEELEQIRTFWSELAEGNRKMLVDDIDEMLNIIGNLIQEVDRARDALAVNQRNSSRLYSTLHELRSAFKEFLEYGV